MVKTAELIGALALVMLLSGCTVTPAPSDPRVVWCEQNRPMYPTKESVAVMSRNELINLLTYLEKGEKWCGWKKPTPTGDR